MDVSNAAITKLTVTFGVAAAVCLMAGCGKSDSGTAPAGAGDATMVAAGQAVFNANGCTRCHALNGQGGGMGPDLSHAGAEAAHTPEWFANKVRDPRKDNPGSRMPAFEGKINDKDLSALGAYLASLK